MPRQPLSLVAVHPSNGRPYGITPEQRAALLDAIRAGNVFTTSCQLAGVNHETFCDWMIKGGDPKSSAKDLPDEPREPYRSFALAVRQAEAEAEKAAVEALTGAFEKDWKAAAHYLRVRRPNEWGEKNQTQIAVGGDVYVYLPDNGRSDFELADGASARVEGEP